MLEVFQLTLGKVGMLLIFIGIGYFLRWHHDLPDDAGRVLSLLCTLVFLPAYFITNLSKNITMEVLEEKARLVGYGAIFVVSAILLSFLLSIAFNKKDKIERNSLIYAFAIPNYGYFGYPVIEGVFGSAMLADVMVFLIPLSLTAHSVGYALFIGDKKVPLKKVLLTPIFVSLIISICLGLSGIVLPTFLDSALKGLGNCMSPCSMLLAGFMLGKFSLKELLNDWRPYFYSSIRLIGIPAIFFVLLKLCNVGSMYMMFPLLVAGIPMGLNLVVYPESQGYERQASDNAKLCFVSYLMALLILPCTYALLSSLAGM